MKVKSRNKVIEVKKTTQAEAFKVTISTEDESSSDHEGTSLFSMHCLQIPMPMIDGYWIQVLHAIIVKASLLTLEF